jgi:hypothetical protein
MESVVIVKAYREVIAEFFYRHLTHQLGSNGLYKAVKWKFDKNVT